MLIKDGKIVPSKQCVNSVIRHIPDSKVHEAYMGPTWDRQDPGGPHVGPMNLAIRDISVGIACFLEHEQI